MNRSTIGSALLSAVLALATRPGWSADVTWDADPVTAGIQDGAGSWDTSTANWDNAGVNGAWINSPADGALIGNGGTAGTITLTTGITAVGLTFAAVGGNYLVTGNTLTLSGTPALTVNDDAATINSLLAGTGCVKSGSGTLTLGAASGAWGGGITISQGALVLGSASAGGAGGITLGDAGTGAGAAELDLGANLSFANAITVANQGSGTVMIKDLATGLPHVGHAGGLAVNRAVTLKTSGTGDHSMAFDGIVSGSGTLTIDGVAGSVGAGNNRVSFGNAGNTFTGNVIVTAGGQLQNNVSNIFGPQATCVTSLQLDGYFRGGQGRTVNIAALTGSGQLNGVYGGGNNVVVGCNNAGGTFAGTLTAGASGGTLTKVGSGTQILTGANTIGQGGGNVTISGGTLQYGNGGATGSAGTASIINNATLVINRSTASTWSQGISGSGAFIHAGSGVTTFSAANSYTGATTINGGVLSVATLANGGANSGIGASSSVAGNLVLGGGTLRYTGATVAINRAFTLTAATAGGFDVATAGTTLTISGASAATTGALVKSGPGTLVLGVANGHTGGATVSAGALQLNHATAAGSGAVTLCDANTGASNVQLTFNIGNVANAITVSNNGAGTAKLYGNGQFLSHIGAITLNRATVFEIPAMGTGSDWWFGFGTAGISGAGPLTIKGGSGGTTAAASGNRVTLGGAHTYSGGTTIESGKLQLNSVAGAGTGSITLGNANTGAAVTQLRVGANIANPIVISSLAPGSAAAIGTYNSLQVLGGALQVDRALTLEGGSDRLTWSGAGAVWSGAGNITVSGGRVTHEGAANTWTGNLTINGSSVFQPGHAATLTAANSVTVNGTFQLNGASLTINGLSGGGVVQNIWNANTLTVGAGHASASFSGVIQNGAGVMTLVKEGSGAQALTGNNAYTGNTTINGGTLRANSSAGSATGTGVVTVNPGGKLGGSGRAGVAAGNLTVAAGGVLTPGATEASTGTLTLLGNLVLQDNAVYAWEFGAGSGDKVHVNGNVTLPAACTVNVTGLTAGYPLQAILLEWDGVNLGTTNLGGWALTSGFTVIYDGAGKRVLLSAPGRGTTFLVR